MSVNFVYHSGIQEFHGVGRDMIEKDALPSAGGAGIGRVDNKDNNEERISCD